MPEEIDILLVDDSESDRELFRLALEAHGHSARLVTMGDGAEAHRLLAVKADSGDIPPPHVIVLDMRLPGMSGNELLGFVKNNHYVAQTPVVMLSDMPESVMREQLQRADLIQQKPSRWSDFVELIDRIVRLAQRVA